MSALDAAFGVCAVIATVGGVGAVLSRRVVHAALWLVVALLGVAGALLVLGHELVALVLVLVYVGAVVVLVVFALMLTRAPMGPDVAHAPSRGRLVAGAVAGVVTTVSLLAALLPLAGDGARRREVANPVVAQQLFTTWVWPFEVLSVVLLVALIAALALTRRRT